MVGNVLLGCIDTFLHDNNQAILKKRARERRRKALVRPRGLFPLRHDWKSLEKKLFPIGLYSRDIQPRFVIYNFISKRNMFLWERTIHLELILTRGTSFYRNNEHRISSPSLPSFYVAFFDVVVIKWKFENVKFFFFFCVHNQKLFSLCLFTEKEEKTLMSLLFFYLPSYEIQHKQYYADVFCATTKLFIHSLNVPFL